ncbi:MAG: hypothetical protein ACRDJ4_15540 [Actinomycetota bacterium]
MRRYLVVANQTLGGDHLAAEVRRCLQAGPSRFHVLVPATPPGDHAVWTEGEAHVIAEERLERALADFRGLGAEADGEVGDANAVQAIADVLRGEEFDEIILSTLPPGLSRWLRQDLPHRVQRFGLPVRHVAAGHEPEVTR